MISTPELDFGILVLFRFLKDFHWFGLWMESGVEWDSGAVVPVGAHTEVPVPVCRPRRQVVA